MERKLGAMHLMTDTWILACVICQYLPMGQGMCTWQASMHMCMTDCLLKFFPVGLQYPYDLGTMCRDSSAN